MTMIQELLIGAGATALVEVWKAYRAALRKASERENLVDYRQQLIERHPWYPNGSTEYRRQPPGYLVRVIKLRRTPS